MKLFIDFQAFKIQNNTFAVKELAAYDGNKSFHYIFKPPCAWHNLPIYLQKEAKYLMKNHHCLNWNCGFIELNQLPLILNSITKNYDQLYVKGKEKAAFLSGLIGQPVLEVEQPKLQITVPKCSFHSKTFAMCALSNVILLYDNLM